MNIEIEKHEYNLRRFIDIALRYSTEMILKSRTETNMFPFVDVQIKNLRHYFESFKSQLTIERDKPENGQAFETDIKNRFLPMIIGYNRWYEEHKEETKKFEPYNFFEWVYENMVSTMNEINWAFQTSITPIEFVFELSGYFDKKLNDFDTSNPIFITQEIKNKLIRFNKTPLEAQRLLTNYKSAFPKDFFENVVKALINKLNDLDYLPQQTERTEIQTTMIRGLAPFELQGYYRMVLEIGIDGLKGIEIIQAEQLKQFASGIMEKNNEVAYNFYIANPEFNYPLEYLENPLEYWKRNSSGYNEPETVIDVIDTFLNKNKNKNLTQQEQAFIISKVKEIRDLVINDSVEQKINSFNSHIRGALTERPESKHRDFFIEKLRDEVALLDGSFDSRHRLKSEPIKEKKKDTRYWLTTIENNQAQISNNYEKIKDNIDTHGHFIVSTSKDRVKVYSPEVAFIFCSDILPVKNLDTQEEIKINGGDYIKTYIEAYKNGEQYFEDEFKVSTNIIYGANAEQYVRDIHLNYFHVQHTGTIEGWGFVKKFYPPMLTHKAIQEFGYYSGIVSKVEELVKKYPKQFATFDKCEHEVNPKQGETPQTIKKAEQDFENAKPKTFSDVFTSNDFAKYLNALVNCTPQLLNSNYEFVGNQKTQRGVIATWFKYLKSKGIIDQSLSRDELASVLTTQIKNYSIAGSSIDNESTLYKKTFEPQFLELIK